MGLGHASLLVGMCLPIIAKLAANKIGDWLGMEEDEDDDG